MNTDNLSTLGMISICKEMMSESKNLNEKVIKHFSTSQSYHMDFILKD